MDILTVDWDYFFPDGMWYDMGHAESPLYFELLWHTRVTSVNLKTGASILDDYVPTVPDGFWDLVLSGKPTQFIVSESHLAVHHYIEAAYWIDPGNVSVTNIDAHDDLGYGGNMKMGDGRWNMDCGNWAEACLDMHLIDSYANYYPEWRRDAPERDNPKRTPQFGLPPKAKYDLVHLCRSGAWTPPWYDHAFRALVDSMGMNPCYTEEADNMIRRNRQPNMDRADELRKYIHTKGGLAKWLRP